MSGTYAGQITQLSHQLGYYSAPLYNVFVDRASTNGTLKYMKKCDTLYILYWSVQTGFLSR